MTKTLREPLSLSFPSTLLSPFLSRICMCARAFSPLIPPRICFSPTITINPYHQYFPFTLFAPLIFHSAWRLSWNLVNTGKLKTSSKGLSYLNVASFSRKKFYERPYTSLLTLRVALLSHGYYTSVNFYFFPSFSFSLSLSSPHFSILKRNYVFSIAMTLFSTFISFHFYFRNKITGWKEVLATGLLKWNVRLVFRKIMIIIFVDSYVSRNIEL